MEKVKLTIGKVINFFKNLLERVLLIYKNKEILIKTILLFIFPIYVVFHQYNKHLDFMVNYGIIYFISFSLLIFCVIRWIKEKQNKTYTGYGTGLRSRRFYFVYLIFLMILLYPDIERYNFFNNDSGIFGLPVIVSIYLVGFFIFFIIYLIIFSDLNISEISLFNTKLSMQQEEYKTSIDEYSKLTNSLTEKVITENRIIQGMRKYCISVRKRLSPDGSFVIPMEYQAILSEYYKILNDDVKVAILSDLEILHQEYDLTLGEFQELSNRMKEKDDYKVFGLKKKDMYLCFMSYSYKFENFRDILYIVLESKSPIAFKFETGIIANILMVFSDEMLNRSAIDFKKES